MIQYQIPYLHCLKILMKSHKRSQSLEESLNLQVLLLKEAKLIILVPTTKKALGLYTLH